MDKIDTWIKDRFGTTNTFNRQLLDNFIEFLEKELGYVRKDPDQKLPPMLEFNNDFGGRCGSIGYTQGRIDMLKEHWVKVKEEV